MGIFGIPTKNYLSPGSNIDFTQTPATINSFILAPDYFRTYSVSSSVLTEQEFFNNANFLTSFATSDINNGIASIYIRTTSVVLSARPRIRFYSGLSLLGVLDVPAFTSGSNDTYFVIPNIPILNCRVTCQQLTAIADGGSQTKLIVLMSKSVL